MTLTKETARALLKLIEADAKAKVKNAGGDAWTRVGDSDEGVTLVVKIYADEKQTEITDFSED